MASPTVAGSSLSFAQLEELWIQAGGNPSIAPVMAAIAKAESGGNPNALNPTDNHGMQSSYGLWQISTGTHAPPASNWNDPLTNAQLAVAKYNAHGLSPWGTYTSGAYKQYLPNGYVPPAQGNFTATPADYTSSSTGAVKHYFQIHGPLGLTITLDPLLWAGMIALGAMSIIAGGAFIAIGVGMESKTARQITTTAAKLGKIG